MKEELSETIMSNFSGVRAKTYSFWKDGSIEDKQSERHKKM